MSHESPSCPFANPAEGTASPGFFSLFGLPPAQFKIDALKALGRAQAVNMAGISRVAAGYTYLGQFLVHDISRLARGGEASLGNLADITDLVQLRTPSLDLDSVYGDGFEDSEALVDAATGKMLLGVTVDDDGNEQSGGDLPRHHDGRAHIPDSRNDENLLTAQLHLQFLKLHNHFVDLQKHQDPRKAFEEGRREVTLHYQAVVLHDFLRELLDPIVWAAIIQDDNSFIWKATAAEQGKIPVEFSAAAMRFGHPMVLDRYRTSQSGKTVSLREMFNLTGNKGINGQTKLNQERIVDWALFFPSSAGNVRGFNFARTIKPWVWLSRNKEGAPRNALPASNLLRGNELGLPDAQSLVGHLVVHYPDLAMATGLRLLRSDEVNPRRLGTPWHVFEHTGYADELSACTPLWYYILAEALAQQRGQRLGTLGSIIVAETLRALTVMSTTSILREPNWTPLIEPQGSYLTMRDLIDAV